MNATRSLSIARSAPALALVALAAACSGGDFTATGGPILDFDASGVAPPGTDAGAPPAADAGADATLDGAAPPNPADAADAADAPTPVDASDASDASDAASDASDAAPTCPSSTPTLCGATCVDTSKDPAHCGDCTTSCPAPGHATATCASARCGFACDTGYHACGSACADDTSTATCGGSCSPCPTPPHASPTCDGKACGYTCDPGWTDCDGDASNGCEANLAADAANCGACGHSCFVGACAASACQPGVLGTTTGTLNDLTVDDANVYYAVKTAGTAAGGVVYAVSKSGGSSTAIVGTQGAANGVACDASNVYVTDNAGAILRWSKSTHAVTKLYSDSTPKTGIAVGGSLVYWTSGSLQVGSMLNDGTNVTFSATSSGAGIVRIWTSERIAADANAAFFTDERTEDVLPFTGAAIANDGMNDPFAVALDATSVYFTSLSGSPGVTRVGRDGSNPRALVTGHAYGIAVDDTYAYFTDDAGGTVSRVSKAGGQPLVLASGQGKPTNIVADAKAIYWIDTGSGQVMLLAK